MKKLLLFSLITLLLFLTASAGQTDSQSKTIAGKVTGIFIDTDKPYLTIQSGGDNIKINLSKNYRIFYHEAEAFSLYLLAEGDMVKIILDKDGNGEKIFDDFELLSGLILYFDSHELLLETGQILEYSPASTFYLNGVKVSSDKITKGMRCWARVDGAGWAILRADAYSGGSSSANAAGWKPAPPGVKSIAAQNSGRTQDTGGTGSWLVVAFEQRCDEAIPCDLKILDIGRLPAMPLKAGEKLDLFIKTAPGCSASVQIPGVTGQIPLKELGGGIYKTLLKTGNGPDLKNGIILFTISDNKNTWTNVLSPLSIAVTAPEILQFSPAGDSVINFSTPSIFAVYDSRGALIDTTGVHLWVNDKEVTYKCQRTVNMIFYLPEEPLPPGKIKIKLRLKDQAGNITEKEWNFTIKGKA